MAKMKRPIGDMVSGKVGNVMFVVRESESYVRAAPQRKKSLSLEYNGCQAHSTFCFNPSVSGIDSSVTGG